MFLQIAYHMISEMHINQESLAMEWFQIFNVLSKITSTGIRVISLELARDWGCKIFKHENTAVKTISEWKIRGKMTYNEEFFNPGHLLLVEKTNRA
jgi:hypothetical protein